MGETVDWSGRVKDGCYRGCPSSAPIHKTMAPFICPVKWLAYVLLDVIGLTMTMTQKWRDNIETFKKNGSKVTNKVRQEIIRPKRSWWADPEFKDPSNGIPDLELARMRHNTQGITAGDSF